MSSEKQFDSVDEISAESIVHTTQTDGSHDGVQHCMLTDASGDISGDWGDDGERFYPDLLKPSTVHALDRNGMLADDCEIYRIDTGSDAPWTWVEKNDFRPPRPGAEKTAPSGTYELVEIPGISDGRRDRIHDSVGDGEQVAGLVDLFGRDHVVEQLSEVDGISDALANRILDFVENGGGPVAENGADGEDLSDEERHERIAEQIRDRASGHDVVTCVADVTWADVKAASALLDKPGEYSDVMYEARKELKS